MAEDKPTTGSAVTVGTMTNSVVQQNSPGAIASIRVISGGEAHSIRDVLKQVVELIGSLPLATVDRDEMEEDIGTAEAQLKSKKPKAGILSTCLRSLLAKLTTAVGTPLAAAVASRVQAAIDGITSLLGSL